MSADKNYESHVSETNTWIAGRLIPEKGVNALDYSDILKFSNCDGAVVDQCYIEGGKEDCIDAVRGSNYTFKNCDLAPEKNGITIKGSIDGVNIENVTFDGHGKECDIDIGQFDNYWYIGRAPTRNITIKNVRAKRDGNPIKIRLWDSETPNIIDSNVKVIRVPKFIWWPYFVFRAIQTRGIKNVTKPVDAGSFIKTK
jgi:hypothetical protein